MPVGPRSTRSAMIAITIATVIAFAACGDRGTPSATPLERSIIASLRKRLGVPVGVRCTGTVPRCGAMLLDGTLIPITVAASGGDVEWRVDGLLVTSDQLEAYLEDELVEL